MCKSKWTFFPTYTVFTTTIQIRYTYPIGILISVHEKIIRQCLIITFFRKSQWTKSKEATELKGDLHGCPCESYTLLRLPLTASKQPRDGLWYKVSLEEVKELSTVCCSLCFRACGSIYWCHLHSMQKNIYFSWNHFREIFVKLISRKKHEKIIMIFGKINLVNSVTDFFHYFVWFLPIM